MTVGLLSFAVNPANNNRVTINANSFYLNLAKGFGFPSQDPTTVSSDGYPLSTPSSVIIGNPSMPPNYYGNFVWKWTGQGSMQTNGAFIVASGGTAITELGAASGDFSGNCTLTGQTAPKVVFAFGFVIQSISNNGSGLIRVATKTGFVGNSSVVTGTLVNITGANANTGANATWTVTKIDAQTFDLQNSTFTNAQASPGGNAVYAATNLSVKFHNAGTYSGMGGLVWCRSADESAITAGQIIDATYISQLQFLFNQTGGNNSSRGWLRFMDLVGVQSSFECDFSQRIPSTFVNYPSSSYRSGYWAGAITNTSDVYTCSDPSVSTWNGSSYIDNAIVQGTASATNTTALPTLNVGGHGAKPIFNYGGNNGPAPFQFQITAAPPSPGTDVMVFTFQASWLTGDTGLGTNLTFTYNTVAGDTTVSALNGHLVTALQANSNMATAKIFFGNSGEVCAIPPTAQSGRLSITYTSGPAICNVGSMNTSTISASGGTFIYNYLLDGWIYRSGGMTVSVPFEAIVDMCNRAGAHCWFNWGITKGAFVTAVTQFFGDSTTGLTSGLRFGNEPFNEIWNSGANPYPLVNVLGLTLGWSTSSNVSVFSYSALKIIQYSSLGKTAWTGKGRSASDYYVLQPTQGANLNVGGNFDSSSLRGNSLVTSNTNYATYGGLNGGSAPSYNTAPNRPVDITNAIGYAPYWNSQWLGTGSFTQATQFKGTATQNADLLTAALNFANGSVSTAFTALVNEFNGTTTKSGGSTGGTDLSSTGEQSNFTAMEALCAQYDGAGRVTAGLPALGVLHYEGGPSFGSGANGNNGVNSLTFNTVLTADITALANQFTALDSPVGSFNCSPYTQSGTDNKTEMATMVLQMLQAWKYDVTNTGVAANTGSYKGLIKTSYYQALKTTSGANRETKPCQYGYAAQNWGMWPSTPFDLAPYQNYNAISEWNAGG